MKFTTTISLAGWCALALVVSPLNSNADESSAQGTPFQGKVSSVDKDTRTLIIDSQSYQVLPTTQIKKDNQAANFESIKPGEQLSGVYKKSAEDKMEVISLELGSATGGTADSAEATSGQSGESFSGKVAKIDPTAKTITIGTDTYQVLPTTRINIDGRAATFTQIQTGKQVSGNYKQSAENKKEIISMQIGSAVGGTKDSTATETGARFNGKITKVDTAAQTFTIGTRTFQLLPTTQLSTTGGGTASISNLKVGQTVSGTYKQSAENKMEVVSLQVGSSAKP